MKIIFKAKATPRNVVLVPAIKKRHCIDEGKTRCDQYSNSDLCAAMVVRELDNRGIGKRIDLNNLPSGVTVVSGFLHEITISGI
jgi:hypothetical protein